MMRFKTITIVFTVTIALFPISLQHNNSQPPSVPSIYSSPSHYWAGVSYNGATTTSTDLYVPITVPNETPSKSFYYVMLSVWDNNSSYDQIGFADNSGSWEVAYSTSNCVSHFYYSANAYGLTAGTTYNFSMSISNGYVVFNVSGLWTLAVKTGGTYFEVQTNYSCGASSYADYTEYEEVYNYPTAKLANDLVFGNTSISGWQRYFSGISTRNIAVSITGASVDIKNGPCSAFFGCILTYQWHIMASYSYHLSPVIRHFTDKLRAF